VEEAAAAARVAAAEEEAERARLEALRDAAEAQARKERDKVPPQY
jgi:hypothetical protein